MSALPEKLKHWQRELTAHPGKKIAWKIIEDYFRFSKLQEVKDELWMLTTAALTNDELEKTKTGIDRHNRIFFYEHFCLLIEAMELVGRKRNKKNKGIIVKES